jgi:hypothetical protein
MKGSEFKYMRNQASKSLVSSKGHTSSKKIFPTFIPFRSILPCWLSSAVKKAPQLQHSSLRVLHAIQSGLIANHSPFVQSIILFLLSNRIFFHLQKLNLFPVFVESLNSCCLPMSITIAWFIGMRHTNVSWKPKKDKLLMDLEIP